MGANVLLKPGSINGPCESHCNHVECKATRERAQALCRFCGLPIGYETCFYCDPGDAKRFTHASCLEDFYGI
jgi:3-mercaptopyruvate sulfurtransferase SseA